MKIMTIMGSPRKKGNTAALLAWTEAQLRDDGHEVDHVDLMDHAFGGCGECKACQKSGAVELCAVKDGANPLFHRMIASDLVLIAAPVFCWAFPAHLKALTERMYCLMDLYCEHPGAPRLHDKPMALLLTAGGPEQDNADLVVRTFEHVVRYVKATDAGHLVVCDCPDVKAMGADLEKRARDFGRALAPAPSPR